MNRVSLILAGDDIFFFRFNDFGSKQKYGQNNFKNFFVKQVFWPKNVWTIMLANKKMLDKKFVLTKKKLPTKLVLPKQCYIKYKYLVEKIEAQNNFGQIFIRAKKKLGETNFFGS